ncbi:hypothetical protein [Mycobacterium sp. 4858]|uniref:hypothetical protein n=1 Tax=Mycobacterium sp. 4858 TaxID=2057185 RepID=UPI00115BF172|nr:hypothetical protein [Mycobacterium sp. 4858]
MSVNDRSAASRQFVASPPSIGSTMTAIAGKQTAVLYGLAIGVGLGVGVAFGARVGLAVGMALFFLIPLPWLAYLWWRSHRKVLIDVTSDGLTVNQRPGRVFSFVDAQIGAWVTTGVALHLQCDSHRFVLGARDRRIAPATRLDAPPVQTVDAWLSDSEFDELLAIGGRRSGMDVRGPAPGEPTRCLLFPNPYLAEQISPYAIRKQLRLQRSLSQPSLVLDVDNDAIRVIDPNGNTLKASASGAQVIATPAIFQPDSVTSGDGSTYNYPAITGMVVGVPGVQPLPIGCLALVGSGFRFSWRDNVPSPNERPAYVVSGADWLTLTEKFALTRHLEDRAASAHNLPTGNPTADVREPLSGRDHGDTARSRRRDRPRILTILGSSVLSLALIAIATFLVWNQHFGAPARMTVERCWDRGAASDDMPFNNCYAHPSDAPHDRGPVISALPGDVGHDIEVHRTGTFVIKDTWWEPLLLLGLGGAAGVSAVRAIVRRIRRAPNVEGSELLGRN